MLFRSVYAKEDGIREGRAAGKTEGLAQGVMKGEEKINRLGILLTEAGRSNDFLASLSDRELQQKLFAEFGL